MATEENIRELRFRLEDGSIKCSERCLYQSAKWYLLRQKDNPQDETTE